jgi:hypothetical protein
MAALRFVSSVFLLVAAVILVADLTHARTAVAPSAWISLAKHWSLLAPQSLAAAQRSLQATSSLLWDPLVKSLLAVPAWLVFASLGAACGYAGRRRRRVNIFTN